MKGGKFVEGGNKWGFMNYCLVIFRFSRSNKNKFQKYKKMRCQSLVIVID